MARDPTRLLNRLDRSTITRASKINNRAVWVVA
jgi:hypothetical protein